MNHVTLIGRLTRDPELSYTKGTGTPMTKFSVAVDKRLSKEKKQEMEANNQPTADFINCVCWGRLAETIPNFTAKGKRVGVEGRIQTGSYVGQDGIRRYTTDIVVENIEFIDWKDRDWPDQGQGYRPAGPNKGADDFPENKAAAENQRNESDDGGDDFLDSDFSPVDDDRIPF